METPVGDILGAAWSKCGVVLLFTLLGASLDASKLSLSFVGMGVMLVVFFTLILFPQ